MDNASITNIPEFTQPDVVVYVGNYYNNISIQPDIQPRLMNCLAYALRFWELNPEYRIYYNSGHAINCNVHLDSKTGFLTIEEFGYDYFISSFDGLLDEYEIDLLKQYFGITSHQSK